MLSLSVTFSPRICFEKMQTAPSALICHFFLSYRKLHSWFSGNYMNRLSPPPLTHTLSLVKVKVMWPIHLLSKICAQRCHMNALRWEDDIWEIIFKATIKRSGQCISREGPHWWRLYFCRPNCVPNFFLAFESWTVQPRCSLFAFFF